jgi:hypothetical protein
VPGFENLHNDGRPPILQVVVREVELAQLLLVPDGVSNGWGGFGGDVITRQVEHLPAKFYVSSLGSAN